jgi:hypothetical protein
VLARASPQGWPAGVTSEEGPPGTRLYLASATVKPLIRSARIAFEGDTSPIYPESARAPHPYSCGLNVVALFEKCFVRTAQAGLRLWTAGNFLWRLQGSESAS